MVSWRAARGRLCGALLALAGLLLFGQGTWIHAKALLAQVLLERAFAHSLATGTIVKPWPWADTWPVARIEIPRLSMRAIVLHGGNGQALAFGPGHVDGTPEPGARGTAVYAAHRDTHFSGLGDIAPGDRIDVTRRDGARLRFQVTHTAVVRFDASGIDAHARGEALALTTCWPLGDVRPGPLRFVVHARRVEAP